MRSDIDARRFLERDLERYKARMLAKQKEATSTSGARDDDPSLCQLCLKPTHASTSPVICFDCGRRACCWCACFHWPYVGIDKKYEMVHKIASHVLLSGRLISYHHLYSYSGYLPGLLTRVIEVDSSRTRVAHFDLT